jgi:hypothetical protein
MLILESLSNENKERERERERERGGRERGKRRKVGLIPNVEAPPRKKKRLIWSLSLEQTHQ